MPILCNNAEHRMTKDCNEPDTDNNDSMIVIVLAVAAIVTRAIGMRTASS